MPEHIKMILRHAAIGGVIAFGFVSLLLAMNVANLWHLVTHTNDGPLAVAVLFMFCWITFGSVQIGIRIMMMGEDDGRDGGTRAPEALTVPVPVRIHTEPGHRL